MIACNDKQRRGIQLKDFLTVQHDICKTARFLCIMALYMGVFKVRHFYAPGVDFYSDEQISKFYIKV